MLPDEALVQRSLSSGSQHFGELVKRHSDYLFGFGMRLTGGDRELAQDLSQQTFVRAFRYLRSFKSTHESTHLASAENRFRNWLTGIAVNAFNDLIKTESKYQVLDAHYEPAVTDRNDDSRAFHDLIKPLTAEERVIFILRYIYDYQIDEISNLTDLNAGTVKSKISRALARLREVHDD